MQQVLNHLTLADYHFIVGTITGSWNLTNDRALDACLARFETSNLPEDRAKLDKLIISELSYLGSSDLAFAARSLMGKVPGVPFREIVADVALSLKVRIDRLGTEEEQLVELVTNYATDRFAEMTAEQQQQMLEDLGVDKKRAADFVKRSAGVFAPPLLVEAFNAVIIEGLIKRIIFGTIARFLGKELSRKLFAFIVGRFPWWVSWVGPVAWAGSIGWTVLDLQRPAYRKTIPIVLYLGLCVMRSRPGEDGDL